jgi:glycosyltransferase involved in cell wall biosynthesis
MTDQKSMKERPIAYVMEQTLGNRTHYLNLRREETAAAGTVPRWLPIEWDAGWAPWTLRGSLRARKAVSRIVDEVDGFFFHTTTIAVLTADLFGRKPTVLSTDGTPLNKRHMRLDYGLKAQGGLAESAKREILRQVFRRAAGLVAFSNWAKASLVDDYGCREQDVVVIPPGVRLDDFVPGDRSHEVPRILFVGGDFARKGGEMLLDVYRRRFRGRAELVLVTRSEVVEEPGVQVHRNVNANSDKLRELYATCDVLAVPTKADCFPLVAIEAMAAGMPVVATRVGGIPDVVREGETGYLIDADDADALGDVLDALVSDRQKRAAMARACREDAAHRFDARKNARRLFEFVRSRC